MWRHIPVLEVWQRQHAVQLYTPTLYVGSSSPELSSSQAPVHLVTSVRLTAHRPVRIPNSRAGRPPRSSLCLWSPCAFLQLRVLQATGSWLLSLCSLKVRNTSCFLTPPAPNPVAIYMLVELMSPLRLIQILPSLKSLFWTCHLELSILSPCSHITFYYHLVTAVWGGLTNSCEKKTSQKQKRKGKIYPFECRVSKSEER